jgi:hypothetical protein
MAKTMASIDCRRFFKGGETKSGRKDQECFGGVGKT